MSASSDLVAVLDSALLCRFVSRSFAQAFDRTPRAFIGFDRLGTLVGGAFADGLSQFVSSADVGRSERELWIDFPRHGRRFVRASYARLGESEASHICVTLRDITDRVRTQDALRVSEDMVRTIGRLAKVGGWEVDVASQSLSWTEETYRILEAPLDLPLSMESGIHFFVPEDRPRLAAALAQAMESGQPFDLEMRVLTVSGRSLWTRAIGHPVVVDGKTVKLLGTFQDVTGERLKRAERTAKLCASN